MSERELIERARNGDRTAEREIYDAHVDRVFRLAYRMCGRDDLAEDFVQETFVKAFGALDRFRGDAAAAIDAYEYALLAWRNADPEFRPRIEAARRAITRLSRSED